MKSHHLPGNNTPGGNGGGSEIARDEAGEYGETKEFGCVGYCRLERTRGSFLVQR